MDENKLKIAIIGGGISGASSSYFLSKMFDQNVELVVFEKSDRLGGRLATIEYKDREFELGGSILHPSNTYMKCFLKICGLKKRDDDSGDEFVALFDSNGIKIKKTGDYFGILDKINFIKHFGFFQLLKFDKWINNFVRQFSQLYTLQDNGFVFTSIETFLKTVSPQLYEASQVSLRKVLQDEKFNDRIINELASIATLANYGQTVDMDGFVGLVSLAGCIGDLWSVNNGNKQIPADLIKLSGAKVLLNTKVKVIAKDPNEPETKNLIVYKTSDGKEVKESFDYVLIGFPLYKGVIGENLSIEFDNMNQFELLQMQLTNTYFIYGECQLFDDLPINKYIQLHSVDPDIPYRTVCVNLPVDYSNKNDKNLFKENGYKVYKIFSEKKLDEAIFNKIFKSGYEMICAMPWLAYPKYQTNQSKVTFPDVVLDSPSRSRVFYLNSLEWTSSCMEICCISSRNVSNIIAKKETKRVIEDKKSFKTTNFKDFDDLFSFFMLKSCCAIVLISMVVFLINILTFGL